MSDRIRLPFRLAAALALGGLVIASAGCRLYIAAPEVKARMEGDWGKVAHVPGDVWINERYDKSFQSVGTVAVIRCMVWAADPVNTVEIDVFSKVDVECDVRIDVSPEGHSKVPVRGALRRTDGNRHWAPDRKFHEWSSGSPITLPPHGTVHVVIPSAELFGHYPPREDDTFGLVCLLKADGQEQRTEGKFVVQEVVRDKSWIFGH